MNKPMKAFASLIICCSVLFGCSTDKPTQTADSSKVNPVILPDAPQNIADTIHASFPNAVPAHVYADTLLKHLKQKYGVLANQILLGVSTCVDDIIYTKNLHVHSEIKGPFHLGGLAGLPFTGISGLEAFAHHIPEGGTMLLMIEPHIGISEKKGWGYIIRPEQHESSSCCGALMGTLAAMKKGVKPAITEEDYQGDKILELADEHKNEIMSARNQILELTQITSRDAERQIRKEVLDVTMKHVKYIVIVTGVLINTDYQYSDYQATNHLMVYDVGKKEFVEDLKNP
jgi:hypothetical protein